MSQITITMDGAKLFAFILHYYITHEGLWHSEADDLISTAFGKLNQLTHDSFQNGLISEKERDNEFDETDRDISEWQGRLDAWYFKRYCLRQYETYLCQQTIFYHDNFFH